LNHIANRDSHAGEQNLLPVGFSAPQLEQIKGAEVYSVHPIGEKSQKCPHVEGHVLRLSGRNAKVRRERYRKDGRGSTISPPRTLLEADVWPFGQAVWWL